MGRSVSRLIRWVIGATLVLFVHLPVAHALSGVWAPVSEHDRSADNEEPDPEPSAPEIEDSDLQEDAAVGPVPPLSPVWSKYARLGQPQLVRAAPLRAPFLDPEVPPPRR